MGCITPAGAGAAPLSATGWAAKRNEAVEAEIDSQWWTQSTSVMSKSSATKLHRIISTLVPLELLL